MADKIKLSFIRQKFPMYKDVPDDQLLIAVRQKFYPSLSARDFYSRVDYDANRPNPTDGMSAFDKFMAGAGKSVADTGQGVGQLLGLVNQADVDESSALDRPLMETGAGVAGNIAGEMAQLAIPLGGGAALASRGAAKVAPKAVAAVSTKLGKAAPVVAGAAENAILSGAKPVETGESRASNAAGGAVASVAGNAVGAGLAKASRGAADAIAPNIRALYEKAIEMGIPVRADQLGDSKFLKTLASTLERLPLTGGQAAQEAQQEAFNRAVSRQFGADTTKITPEVYAAAKRRIGGQFEALSGRNNLTVDDVLTGRLNSVVDEAGKFGDPATANAVKNAVDGVLSRADSGVMPGRAYQSMDSMLGKLTKTGGEKAHFLGQVRETLRNAMDGSISPADKEAWQLARTQYKALKTVRDLVAKDGASGDISPALLAGRVNASNAGKEAMASGRAGDMGDLAMIGRQFVRDPIPNSGTADRLFAGSILPLVGAGAGAYNGDGNPLVDAAQGALLASVVGRGATKALNSPAVTNYMANGLSAPAQALLRSGAKAAPIAIPAAGNVLFVQ